MTSDICQNFCSKIFMTGDGKDWTLTRTRTLTSSSSPDYAVLEASGQGVIVSSDKPFKLVSDSQSSPQTAAVGTTQEQEMDREGGYGQAPFGEKAMIRLVSCPFLKEDTHTQNTRFMQAYW